MRPTLLRRFVAGLAALALILTMGVQGMQAAAMVTMKSDMSMSMTAASEAASDKCTNCDGSEKSAITQCQTASICAPSVAVLPMTEAISVNSQPVRFGAENVIVDGRTGTPELHPPKPAALR